MRAVILLGALRKLIEPRREGDSRIVMHFSEILFIFLPLEAF